MRIVVFSGRILSLCCGCGKLGAGKTCSSFPSVNYVTGCDAVISVTLFVCRKLRGGNMTRLLLNGWFSPRFVAVFLWVQHKEKVAPCGCSKNKPSGGPDVRCLAAASCRGRDLLHDRPPAPSHLHMSASRLPLSQATFPAKGTTSAVTLHSWGADTFHLAFPSHSIQERR